jgi:adhesin/invasin
MFMRRRPCTINWASSDPTAVLPGPYTYTAADAGVHTFDGLVLNTLGSQTITVSDPVASGQIALTVQ